MKFLVACAFVVASLGCACAQGYGTGSRFYERYVNGYTNSRGIYVAPHYQTSPSGTLGNYGTRNTLDRHLREYGTRIPW